MSSEFSHIHLHTEYSLLDGLTKISKLFKKVKEMNMDSVAITDHGAMYGAIEFYKTGQKEGVKPIIGMEAYTTPIDHNKKDGKEERQIHHLLLLAKDEEGYKNLMKISSIAWMEGYYYRPRIDRPTLAKYAKGLICTSACPAGELAGHLIENDEKGAREVANWFLNVFGEDYYLEVQRHNFENHIANATNPEIRAEMNKMIGIEKTINEGVLKLSRELGIPIVATNDSHYLNKEDAPAQDALVCVATGKMVSDIKRIRFIDCPEFYVKSPEEMKQIFSDIPEAISNTVKVADKCNLTISTLGKWFFPKYEVPGGVSADEYLRKLAQDNIKEKYAVVTPQLEERLAHELEIIIKKGYAPYFLIVQAMVTWARENGIITNTRGSAAGSLVSFVLGVTTVDPIKYYLPFERFLNPFRPTPPDIDFDVADIRRDEVISYMADTYGHEKVAQICTFGRMLARAAARDIARVLGYEYAVGDRISKMIPPPKQGFPINVDKALATSPELKSLYENDKDAKLVLDLARQVEGSARHLSMHAAGVVIAPTDIREFSPIQKEQKEGKVITQYEMHACEEVGLIKFDILGIRNLSILGAAISIVSKERGIEVDLHHLPLDDKKTFEMLARGETMGVFQLASGGMTKYLMDLQPTKIEDLMAMVALYRPGPMAVIPEYIARKNNPSLVKFLDPRMEKFLGASYGLLVYQDDLLFCALDLAGYTWEEADKFRKAVGKKIPEEMAAQKDKFVQGIVAHGQTEEFAEMLWKLFEPFQSYGFNKAHAASYGMVAYQTAYMKANFPVEYMTALMSAESGDTEKISAAISECKRMKIVVKNPDINESETGFAIEKEATSLDGKAIRFGFSAIKNVGHAAIDAILEGKKEGKFTSFGNFCARVDGRRVNKRVLESLIKAGAMGAFGNRASLLGGIDTIRAKTKSVSDNSNQQELFVEEKKEIIASPLVVTQTINDIPEFTENILISLERELMGFSLSAPSILELASELVPYRTHTIEELSGPSSEIVKVACVIGEVRSVVTRKTAAQMAFLKVDDGTGTLEAVIFPKLYMSAKAMLLEQHAVLLTGKIDMRDDKPNMLVDSVETHEMVKEKAGSLKITIPRGITASTLKTLKDLLLEFPGKQDVSLFFEGTQGLGTSQEIKIPFRVSWTQELSRKIALVLQPNSN